MKKYVHGHDEEGTNVEGMMKVHAPRVFQALQKSDGEMANVTDSFSLV